VFALGRTLTDEMGAQGCGAGPPASRDRPDADRTDTVFALGAGDDVVGISDYTKYPAAALTRPSVGDLIKPSIETILSLHPDLVIGTQPKGPMEVTDQRTGRASRSSLSVRTALQGYFILSKPIGMALNRTPQADALIHSLRQRVDAVTGANQRPACADGFYAHLVMTRSRRSERNAFITEIIEAAGGRFGDR